MFFNVRPGQYGHHKEKRLCGSDGLTYSSYRDFKTVKSYYPGLYIVHKGPCKLVLPPPDSYNQYDPFSYSSEEFEVRPTPKPDRRPNRTTPQTEPPSQGNNDEPLETSSPPDKVSEGLNVKIDNDAKNNNNIKYGSSRRLLPSAYVYLV